MPPIRDIKGGKPQQAAQGAEDPRSHALDERRRPGQDVFAQNRLKKGHDLQQTGLALGIGLAVVVQVIDGLNETLKMKCGLVFRGEPDGFLARVPKGMGVPGGIKRVCPFSRRISFPPTLMARTPFST